MVNNSKGKLMFITLLLILLLISSTYAIIVPAVNAAKPNLQEKAVSVLSSVVYSC
jgi:competence protein ComGC